MPQLGPCASPGRRWRLWAARHSQGQKAEPLSAEPPPRVLELAASEVADRTAFLSKQDAWQITIDFSPKGGPKDFTGYWDADGIKFPATPAFAMENRWPKIS